MLLAEKYVTLTVTNGNQLFMFERVTIVNKNLFIYAHVVIANNGT